MLATVVLENIGDEHAEKWNKVIVFDALPITCWSARDGHSEMVEEYLVERTIGVTDEVGIDTLRQYERLVGAESGEFTYIEREQFVDELKQTHEFALDRLIGIMETIKRNDEVQS